jgi:iron complex outermembrane recepter protein
MLKYTTVQSALVGFLCSLFLVVTAIADSPKQQVNIPPGDLSTALNALAKQSGADLVYRPEQVKGLKTQGVSGNLTVEDALTKLLAGTPLTVNKNSTGAMLISTPKPHATSVSPNPVTGSVASVNPEVHMVQGGAPADLQEGPEKSNEQSAKPDELEEVRVTGSRIRGAPPASPTVTLTREDMERGGFADLGDAMRSLPQNFSGGDNPGVAGGGDQGGANNLDNSSALNLRGLGPDATLTLINGHRVAYDAIDSGVDISAIPIAAVERVEVVTDGASAVYGSDAVAGVANVILRRDFQGVEATARYGGSTDGGNQQQQYGVTTGDRWESGGMMVALDYSRYTPINASDRSYTQMLNGTQSLVPGQEQHSVILAGHQRLTDGLELDLDASVNDRTSVSQNAFSTTADVFYYGLYSKPQVESYEVTPSLHYQLPGGWEASLSGTYARSNMTYNSQFFVQSAQYFRALLTYDNTLNSAELDAEGPLFSAPGGDARLAVGGGYRSPGLTEVEVETIGSTTTTPLDSADTQHVYFGYTELSVPLVSAEENLHLIHSLTFNAAARYEKYSGLWNVTTPKLGLNFAPTTDVTFRSTWGKSFKAPTLYQDNLAPLATLSPAADYVPPPPGSGPVLDISGRSLTPLQPERATTWTTSVDFHPSAVEGLNLKATYFDIRYVDRVADPLSASANSGFGNPIYNQFITYNPTAQQVLDAIAKVPAGLDNETGTTVAFDPANVSAIVDDTLRNVARDNVRGVDLSGNYSMDVGAKSRLNLTGSASYLESEQQLSPGQPTQGNVLCDGIVEQNRVLGNDRYRLA